MWAQQAIVKMNAKTSVFQYRPKLQITLPQGLHNLYSEQHPLASSLSIGVRKKNKTFYLEKRKKAQKGSQRRIPYPRQTEQNNKVAELTNYNDKMSETYRL